MSMKSFRGFAKRNAWKVIRPFADNGNLSIRLITVKDQVCLLIVLCNRIQRLKRKRTEGLNVEQFVTYYFWFYYELKVPS